MSGKLQNVLVATSLNPPSDAVVAAAAEIAARAGARLHLVHAYALPIVYFAVPTGMTTVDPDLLDLERDRCRELVTEQLERIDVDPGAIASTTAEAGAPHRLLAEASKAVEADLLVVGAHEGGEPGFLGSTADRVLRGATHPVLVVRAPIRLPPERVLAPTDLSRLSADCLRRGLHLVDQLRPSSPPRVDALFVLSPQERDGSLQFKAEQIDRMAQEELQRFLEGVDPDGVRNFVPEVRVGLPRDEILAELADDPEDLVLIGTHGRSGFERFLLGSVAADVARGAACSALVIPPLPAA